MFFQRSLGKTCYWNILLEKWQNTVSKPALERFQHSVCDLTIKLILLYELHLLGSNLIKIYILPKAQQKDKKGSKLEELKGMHIRIPLQF